MSIITMPDELYRVSSAKFNPAYLNTSSAASNWNPQGSINGPTAAFWQPEFTFSISDPETYLQYRRFVMKLRGGKVLCRLSDPTMWAGVVFATQPRGAGGAGPTVNIADDAPSGAETITLKNLIPSQATAFKAQDMIGIGENLYPIEDDAPSNSDGEASVVLGIPLRFGVAADDPVNTLRPTGLFRLVSGSEDLAMTLDGVGAAFTLGFMEVPAFA